MSGDDSTQPVVPPGRRALVLGGSGSVGAAVVRALAARGVPTHFTYWRSESTAQTLARETQQSAERVDLREPTSIYDLFARLAAAEVAPDILIHCAGVLDTQPLQEISAELFDEAYQVSCRSALLASQLMARSVPRGGDIVLVGALDRAQSLPIPIAFAACQGMLSGLSMALAKELGPQGVRVNLLTLGLLDRGLSINLTEIIREQYLAFSASRRFGTVEEAARAIVWLALENRYMSGKTASFNGGI